MKTEEIQVGNVFEGVFEGNVHVYRKILKVTKNIVYFCDLCLWNSVNNRPNLVFNKCKIQNIIMEKYTLIDKVPPERNSEGVLCDFDWVLGSYTLPLNSAQNEFSYHYDFISGRLKRRKKRKNGCS